ncbi:MAG: hypothetical protein H8E18_00175 [FCB group bacterium]|nr:hypothetical protein [FCB group bacterium]
MNKFLNSRIETVKQKLNLKSLKTIILIVVIWSVAEVAITLLIGKSIWDFFG